MFSTIGQVLAAEAEEGQDTLQEEPEDRRQLRARALCPLFHGQPAVEAAGHRVAEAVLLCPVRLVRREAALHLR